jgi:hypothetical protein
LTVPTSSSLIEPVLEALGWDVRDPDEVFREFKPTPKDNPVDYALLLLRKPRQLVEAMNTASTTPPFPLMPTKSSFARSA